MADVVADVSFVKVVVIGKPTMEVSFEGQEVGLRELLDSADIDADGFEIRLNKNVVGDDADPVLRDRDVVLLMPLIKGG